jgi:hypothetical protein
MEGGAREFVQQMLPMYVNEEELGKVGIYREMTRQAWARDQNKSVTRFYRTHREVDVTSMGDAFRQVIVTNPGLDAQVTGTPHDIDLFALLLIHQGVQEQFASERALTARQAKDIRAQQGIIAQYASGLRAMYAKLGKKRRANLAKSDPVVASLCEELEAAEAEERRMDAMEFDYE